MGQDGGRWIVKDCSDDDSGGQHLLAVLRRGEPEGLAKAVVEVALIEETDGERHLAHRQAAAKQALALLEAQPLEPGVGGHAGLLLELTQEGEAIQPEQGGQVFQTVALVQPGHQMVAQVSELGIRQGVALGGEPEQLAEQGQQLALRQQAVGGGAVQIHVQTGEALIEVGATLQPLVEEGLRVLRQPAGQLLRGDGEHPHLVPFRQQAQAVVHLVRVDGGELAPHQVVAAALVDELLAALLHQTDVVVQVHVAAIAELPVVGVGEFNPRQQPGLPVVDAGLGCVHPL